MTRNVIVFFISSLFLFVACTKNEDTAIVKSNPTMDSAHVSNPPKNAYSFISATDTFYGQWDAWNYVGGSPPGAFGNSYVYVSYESAGTISISAYNLGGWFGNAVSIYANLNDSGKYSDYQYNAYTSGFSKYTFAIKNDSITCSFVVCENNGVPPDERAGIYTGYPVH